MVKRAGLLALGGHIANQNASFKELIRLLGSENWEFWGLVNGFRAFETQKVMELTYDYIPEEFAGFVGGAGRFSLYDQEGNVDPVKLQKAEDFFKKGRFDIVVASCGDDHGMQMEILRKNFGGLVKVLVINKTMDNDLGGRDGINGAPFTDFTNGYHTAVNRLVRDIIDHWKGAWTNETFYLVSPFGRETNWVGVAASYYGLADKFIYGELIGYQEHSLDKIYELIVEAQDKNEKKYDRRIAMVIVPEGTKISGISHASSEKDPHGHPKLNPEDLVGELKDALQEKYKLRGVRVGKTYELRDCPPTVEDVRFGKMSAKVIAEAVDRGEDGVESTFKIEGDTLEDIKAYTAPIDEVSKKRYSLYYEKPLWDPYTFEVTGEIGIYYKALFGERKTMNEILPGKPRIMKVFDMGK